jgi:uncharacterized protein YegP (UPF0339 family)
MTDRTSHVKHVVVYQDKADQFRWRAVAGNGETVAEGEAHTREADAARAAQGVFGPDTIIVRAERGTVSP